MNVGRGDLGEVKKFFEQRWEGEPEPSIELLLGEVDSVVRGFLSRYGLSVHKLNGHAIRNAEAFAELPPFSLSTDFSTWTSPDTPLPLCPAALDEATSFFTGIFKSGAKIEPAWRDANSHKQGPGPTTLTVKTPRKPNITSIPILTLGSTPKQDR